MHYYIDGYNIIFRVLHATETLQLQREALIYDLSYKSELFNLDLTIVFDSHYQESDSSRSHLDRLEIAYTSKDETADDYILKAVKHHRTPKQLVVVTSDNHLAWKARSLGAKTEPAEVFMERLQKRFRNYLEGEEEVETEALYEEPELPKAKELEVEAPKVTPSAPFELPKLIQPPPVKSKKAKPGTPVRSPLPEECFEYYQNAFEKEYETIQKQELPTLILPDTPKEEPPQQKIKEPKVGRVEQKLSDRERWLQAFEKSKDKEADPFEGFEPL